MYHQPLWHLDTKHWPVVSQLVLLIGAGPLGGAHGTSLGFSFVVVVVFRVVVGMFTTPCHLGVWGLTLTVFCTQNIT